MHVAWVEGPGDVAATLGLEPDLLVRARRLDWEGIWWTPLWKSGRLRFALDATVFGGEAKSGIEMTFEGELRASIRGLCSPALAREAIEQHLREHVQREVRDLVDS